MKVGDYEIKEGYYYTKKHEWAAVDGDSLKVGISDFAQQALGEITFIDIKTETGPVKEGVSLKSGDKYAEVESHKAVEDVFSPVSGSVVEVNEALMDAPNTINEDPYGEGWILKLKPSSIADATKALLDSEAYAEHVKKEAH